MPELAGRLWTQTRRGRRRPGAATRTHAGDRRRIRIRQIDAWRGRCCGCRSRDGEIRWIGRPVARLQGGALRRARGAAQIVFQDPHAALSPRLTIDEIVVEGLRAQGRPSVGRCAAGARSRRPRSGDRRPQARRSLRRSAPARRHRPRVGAGAGGHRARRADVFARPGRAARHRRPAWRGLQAERGLAYLFITHDLGLARALADDVIVLRQGPGRGAGTGRGGFRAAGSSLYPRVDRGRRSGALTSEKHMPDFALNEDHLAIRDMALAFARDEDRAACAGMGREEALSRRRHPRDAPRSASAASMCARISAAPA